MIENNIFRSEVMNLSSELDKKVNLDGKFNRLVLQALDNQDKEHIQEMFNWLSTIGRSSYSEQTKKLYESLIKFFGYQTIREMCSDDNNEDNRALSDLLSDLNGLVGLDNVKSKVNDLIAYQSIQKQREKLGLKIPKSTLHLAFTGNPGTGKTTVARIVGRIYKKIGLLSKGHFVEVSRTDLIAGYQGQTALKVKKVIESAKGGVLFIDEAYSITENEHSDSYGRECLTELTKALEDYRKDLVVIVAGYTEPMKTFFKSNPGLKSRFNTFIEFNDYSEKELEFILLQMCKNDDYSLSVDALAKVKEFFKKAVAEPKEQFANGRFVRNVYETLIMNQARRLSKIPNLLLQDLKEIQKEDVVLFEGTIVG